MQAIVDKKTTLSKLVQPMTVYPQVLKNVRVKDKAAAQADPLVKEAVLTVENALGNTGRILVRESGTEPVVRVMVEAESIELCEKYTSHVVEAIKKGGYTVD